MIAIGKIDALTVKVVHALCEERQPGLALETVYRWRTALRSGKGISDARKALLVAATTGTDHPVTWADFLPHEHGELIARPAEAAS